MALFTGKGDNGTTKTYGCDQRISKSSAIAEALGAMDEINSFLGICKVKAAAAASGDEDLSDDSPSVFVNKNSGEFITRSSSLRPQTLIHNIQQTLFKIQAELAGHPMRIENSKVKDLEDVIEEIEKQLPPIKTFFISGGTELAAMFDFARTLARRAERRVVAVHEESSSAKASEGQDQSTKIGPNTLAYMNRLSSVLYAIARLMNHKSGITEEPPSYK